MVFKKIRFLTLILACFLMSWGQASLAQEEYYSYDEVKSQLYEDLFGEEIKRSYDYKYWERKGKDQQKIVETGFKILNANKFPRNLRFVVNEEGSSKREINASALYLTGTITVYKGLLLYAENDDEIAAILAHELGHMQQLRTGFWPWKRIKMHFAPKFYEYDADLKGVDYMVKAGYNPIAMITILNKICPEKSALLKFLIFTARLKTLFMLPIDTHPTGSKRLLKVYNHIQTNYPGFLTEGKGSIIYNNFLLNHEKNEDIRKLKEKYDLTIPEEECENL